MWVRGTIHLSRTMTMADTDIISLILMFLASVLKKKYNIYGTNSTSYIQKFSTTQSSGSNTVNCGTDWALIFEETAPLLTSRPFKIIQGQIRIECIPISTMTLLLFLACQIDQHVMYFYVLKHLQARWFLCNNWPYQLWKNNEASSLCDGEM